MHAFEIPSERFSLPAGGAVALHRFVTVDSNGAKQCTASTEPIGVSMNEVTSTELSANERIIEIATGLVVVEAGGAVSAGAAVSSDANGKAVTATASSQDSDSKVVTFGTIVAGVAVTAATAAGQLITVKVK